MPTISLTDATANTEAVAGLINGNNSVLEGLLNGGLDNANIAVAAGIDGTKLDASFGNYVPVWSSTGTAVSLNNGTIVGRFSRLGKLTTGNIVLTIGSTTTIGTGDYSFTLPLAPASTATYQPFGTATFLDVSASLLYTGVTVNVGAGSQVTIYGTGGLPSARWGAAAPAVPASGDILQLSFVYEAA